MYFTRSYTVIYRDEWKNEKLCGNMTPIILILSNLSKLLTPNKLEKVQLSAMIFENVQLGSAFA